MSRLQSSQSVRTLRVTILQFHKSKIICYLIQEFLWNCKVLMGQDLVKILQFHKSKTIQITPRLLTSQLQLETG